MPHCNGQLPWAWKDSVQELELAVHTLQCLRVISQLRIPTDKCLRESFGVRNEVSMRGLRLLTGGNSYMEEMRIDQAVAIRPSDCAEPVVELI